MVKTVVYLTKQKLRFVQFNITNESVKILNNKDIALKDGNFESADFKNIVQKAGLQKSYLIGCLFRYQVGARFFNFPSHDEQEILRMVNYEAAELLPLKVEETITRHVVLNAKQDGYSDTLVVVSPKEEVVKLIEKFQAEGLEFDILNLSSLALFACAQKLILEKEKSSFKNGLLIVYFEDRVVEIIIIKNRKLEFSRGFVLSDAKNFSQGLISEIRHSIELFLDKTEEKSLEKIIVAGHDMDLEVIVNLLKDKFDFPVAMEKKIDIAHGLVVGGKVGLNLLSDEFISQKIRKRAKSKIILSALLIILNFILLTTLFLVTLNNKKVYLRRLKERLSELKPQAQLIQNKLIKIQMLKAQISSQNLILDAISDLVKVAPAACTLNMLSINEAGVLVVRGQAENLQDVLDFVLELEKLQNFKNSHLNYSSRRKIKNKEIIDFEIQTNLHKERQK